MKSPIHYSVKGRVSRLMPSVPRVLCEPEEWGEPNRDEKTLKLSHELLEIANRHTESSLLLSEVTKMGKNG